MNGYQDEKLETGGLLPDSEQALRANLENIVYAITMEPRLFRWNNGRLEWRPKWRPWRWRELPVAKQ